MKLSTLAFLLKCFWFLFCFISLRFCFFAGGVGVGLLIKKGEIVKKVPEDQLLDTLREELLHWEG